MLCNTVLCDPPTPPGGTDRAVGLPAPASGRGSSHGGWVAGREEGLRRGLGRRVEGGSPRRGGGGEWILNLVAKRKAHRMPVARWRPQRLCISAQGGTSWSNTKTGGERQT